MIELTENEKNVFKNINKIFFEEPLRGIEDGLVLSYYDADTDKEFKEVSYGLAKRLLIEVANKRGLKINLNDSFEANEIINNEELQDFNPKYYEDYKTLKDYIENETKEMDVSGIEEFHRKFTHIGGINDSIREFMTKYIPKINNNLYKLSYEIEQEEIKEDILEFPTSEDWETEDEELEENKVEVISSDDIFDWASDDNEWIEEIENQQEEVKEEKLSNEELFECIKFLNSYSKLMRYKSNGQKIVEELTELTKNRKLRDFYDNKEFMENLKKIMEHDKKKHSYLFHGTQCLEDAESIIDQGLGLMKEDLSTTTYLEFTIEDVLLYSRGFGGEIGKSAVVIIDNPIGEDGKNINIVEHLNKKINFAPSGLQGLNGKLGYIVDSRYIIGFVNKLNKKIIFNPKYYQYDKFKNDVFFDKKKNEFAQGLKVDIKENNIGQDRKDNKEISKEGKDDYRI